MSGDASSDPGGDAGRAVEFFRALAHPIRCRMLDQIAGQEEVSRGSLEESLGLPADLASYHLKILVVAGLVTQSRRGRTVSYAVRRDNVAALRDQLAPLAGASLQLVTAPPSPARAAGSGTGSR